ncbi:hypothetical protein AC482_05625 [miscellaneous Crenarchaeota group-15 archaeon DG-45]|uniref:ATP--dephospho-CoA triphosphoribosyl transferase CitG n=1 Tax=miscellaneous Crenarchaeota group-15 archaeon DG-45 TaxID=1685127 RepID=A0A0M0BMW4_9ARCH|nr:MAG: hypothetical protein AC482_05625 [miscellaneous Crenarchaeota group-15 archaeon DG-45]
MGRAEAGDLVARCATLAALLEVSAYPKPGNVHRLRDVPETRYEHFLAGGVAMGPAMRDLALGGYDARDAPKGWAGIGMGGRILKAVEDTLDWQDGGNVNLGIILLFAPLAAAAGRSLQGGRVRAGELREALREATRSTAPADAVAVFEAIRLAVPGRVLGRVEELDVMDDSALKQIRAEGLTILDVFRRCAHRDAICREWVSGFETTFAVGHPRLREAVGSMDVNAAVVDTFLRLLSGQPDSLIARKSGLEKAREVSERAGRILSEGGPTSKRGAELLWALDRELHEAGGLLNPGTTADLTAAAIFVLLLEGWRP